MGEVRKTRAERRKFGTKGSLQMKRAADLREKLGRRCQTFEQALILVISCQQRDRKGIERLHPRE